MGVSGGQLSLSLSLSLSVGGKLHLGSLYVYALFFLYDPHTVKPTAADMLTKNLSMGMSKFMKKEKFLKHYRNN